MHICTLQTDDNLETILKERILIYGAKAGYIYLEIAMKNVLKDSVVAEQEVIFEVDGFDIVEGLISLIASYYFFISYPTRSMIAAMELLLILFRRFCLMIMMLDVKKQLDIYLTIIFYTN